MLRLVRGTVTRSTWPIPNRPFSENNMRLMARASAQCTLLSTEGDAARGRGLFYGIRLLQGGRGSRHAHGSCWSRVESRGKPSTVGV